MTTANAPQSDLADALNHFWNDSLAEADPEVFAAVRRGIETPSVPMAPGTSTLARTLAGYLFKHIPEKRDEPADRDSAPTPIRTRAEMAEAVKRAVPRCEGGAPDSGLAIERHPSPVTCDELFRYLMSYGLKRIFRN